MELLVIFVLICFYSSCHAKVVHKVVCSADLMRVDVLHTEDVYQMYLENLLGYPKCQPEISSHKATFSLPLNSSFYICGTTKIYNRHKDSSTFEHRIILEYKEELNIPKDVITVKCQGITRVKRQNNPLPDDFKEAEFHPSEIKNLTRVASAATPELSMIVLQNGRIINTELNVEPGTPLRMEVSLKNGELSSAGKLALKNGEGTSGHTAKDTYGIRVNFMEVSDTSAQQEVIIAKGCSIDNYLFGNFKTTDGDNLSAGFRAFKFPETNYVLFKGTVNVCLKNCDPNICSNGETAWGRKRRAVDTESAYDYQIIKTVVIKVQYAKGIPLLEGSLSGYSESQPEMPIQGEAIPLDEHMNLKYTGKPSSAVSPTQTYTCISLLLLICHSLL